MAYDNTKKNNSQVVSFFLRGLIKESEWKTGNKAHSTVIIKQASWKTFLQKNDLRKFFRNNKNFEHLLNFLFGFRRKWRKYTIGVVFSIQTNFLKFFASSEDRPLFCMRPLNLHTHILSCHESVLTARYMFYTWRIIPHNKKSFQTQLRQ